MIHRTKECALSLSRKYRKKNVVKFVIFRDVFRKLTERKPSETYVKRLKFCFFDLLNN